MDPQQASQQSIEILQESTNSLEEPLNSNAISAQEALPESLSLAQVSTASDQVVQLALEEEVLECSENADLQQQQQVPKKKRWRVCLIASLSLLALIILFTGIEIGRMVSLKNSASPDLLNLSGLQLDLEQKDAELSLNATFNEQDKLSRNVHGLDVAKILCSIFMTDQTNGKKLSLGQYELNDFGTVVHSWYGNNAQRTLKDLRSAYRADEQELALANNLFFSLFDDDQETQQLYGSQALQSLRAQCNIAGTFHLWGFIPIKYSKELNLDSLSFPNIWEKVTNRSSAGDEEKSRLEKFKNFIKHPGIKIETDKIEIQKFLSQFLQSILHPDQQQQQQNQDQHARQLDIFEVLHHLRILKNLPAAFDSSNDFPALRIKVPETKYQIKQKIHNQLVFTKGFSASEQRNLHISLQRFVYDLTSNQSLLNCSIQCIRESGQSCYLTSPLTNMVAALSEKNAVEVSISSDQESFLTRFLKRELNGRLQKTGQIKGLLPKERCTQYSIDGQRFSALTCSFWVQNAIDARVSVLTHNRSELFYASYTQQWQQRQDTQAKRQRLEVTAVGSIGVSKHWDLNSQFLLSTLKNTSSLEFTYTVDENTQKLDGIAEVSWNAQNSGSISGHFNDGYTDNNFSALLDFTLNQKQETATVFGNIYLGSRQQPSNVTIDVEWDTQTINQFTQKTQLQYIARDNFFVHGEYSYEYKHRSNTFTAVSLSSSSYYREDIDESATDLWDQSLDVILQTTHSQGHHIFALILQTSLIANSLFSYQGNIQSQFDTLGQRFDLTYFSDGQPEVLVQNGNINARWDFQDEEYTLLPSISFDLDSEMQVNYYPFWQVTTSFSAIPSAVSGRIARDQYDIILSLDEQIHPLELSNKITAIWGDLDQDGNFTVIGSLNGLLNFQNDPLYKVDANMLFNDTFYSYDYDLPSPGYSYVNGLQIDDIIIFNLHESVSQTDVIFSAFQEDFYYHFYNSSYPNQTSYYGNLLRSEIKAKILQNQKLVNDLNFYYNLSSNDSNYQTNQLNYGNGITKLQFQLNDSSADNQLVYVFQDLEFIGNSYSNYSSYQSKGEIINNSTVSVYWLQDPLIQGLVDYVEEDKKDSIDVVLHAFLKSGKYILSDAIGLMNFQQTTQYVVQDEKNLRNDSLTIKVSLLDYDNLEDEDLVRVQQRFFLENTVNYNTYSNSHHYSDSDPIPPPPPPDPPGPDPAPGFSVSNFTLRDVLEYTYLSQPKFKGQVDYSFLIWPDNMENTLIYFNTDVNTDEKQLSGLIYQLQTNIYDDFYYESYVYSKLDNLQEKENKFEVEFNSLYTPIPSNVSLNLYFNNLKSDVNLGAVFQITNDQYQQEESTVNLTNNTVAVQAFSNKEQESQGYVETVLTLITSDDNSLLVSQITLIQEGSEGSDQNLYLFQENTINQQDQWNELQANIFTELYLNDQNYFNSTFLGDYNLNSQRATFHIKDFFEDTLLTCYSENIEWSTINNNFVVTGNVFTQYNQNSQSAVFLYANYSEALLGTGFYLTESISGLVINTFFTWNTYDNDALFMFAIPLLNVSTNDGQYLNANVTTGLVNVNDFTTFYFTADNLNQYGELQQIILNFEFKIHQISEDFYDKLIWALQNSLIWNDKKIYSCAQNFVIFNQYHNTTQKNLFSFEIHQNLNTSNAQTVIFNQTAIFEISTDQQQAAILFEDILNEGPHKPVQQKIYVESFAGWQGIGRSSNFVLEGGLDVIIQNKELFYGKLKLTKAE